MYSCERNITPHGKLGLHVGTLATFNKPQVFSVRLD